MTCLILETVYTELSNHQGFIWYHQTIISLCQETKETGNHNWFEKTFHDLGGTLKNVMKLRLMLLLIFSFMTFLRFSMVWKLSRSDKILFNARLFTNKDTGVI